MARKKNTDVDAMKLGAGLALDGGGAVSLVPSFTLRADGPGHLRALILAAKVLPAGELPETLIREFELYEEANR